MTEEEQDRAGGFALRLFVIGFILLFIGVVVLMIAALLGPGGNVSVGGVIIVGPIPIIFGAGPYSFILIVLAIVLTIIAFAMFFWMRKKVPKI